MSAWSIYKRLHPVTCLVASMFIMIFGLVMAKSVDMLYFLSAMLVWFMLFGMAGACLKAIPIMLVVGGAFYGIFYATSGDTMLGLSMTTRSIAIVMAVIPGLSTEPVRMTRSLSAMHMPRAVTLGALIALSFGPMLRREVKRVREAMRTRGAGSVLNPKIAYRAFLVPFIMRLMSISDTLALSVETRGFTLTKAPYSVYRVEHIGVMDVLFIAGMVAGAVLVVVL